MKTCKRCPDIKQIDGSFLADPQSCDFCNPKTFTNKLHAYVEACEELEKIKREMRRLERNKIFYEDKLREHFNSIQQHCGEGGVRIVNLLGVSVVLDWSEESFKIVYAEAERNPEN